MANITNVEAGKKVSEFIQTINDNFKNLNNENKTKQSTIYVMTAGETKINTNNVNITVDADGVPSGGSDGDVIIVYDNK